MAKRAANQWPEDQEAFITEHIRRYSASEIAKLMTAKFGKHFTRNMVIGKATRRHLTMRQYAPVEMPKPRPSKIAPVFAPAGLKTVPLEHIREGMCRFPYDTPDRLSTRCCGCQTVPGKAYCPEHHARCYRMK